MVRSKWLVSVVVALAVPLLGTVVVAGPAAAKKVVATGSIHCTFSQTVSFNPPLRPTGTAGYSKDVITFSPAQISHCTGTTNPAGAVPTFGIGTKPNLVKWPAAKIGSTKLAGACVMFKGFLSYGKYKPHYNWSDTGLSLQSDKVLPITFEEGSLNGEFGFLFTGTARGSFPGPVTIDNYFDAASTAALDNCVAGTGSVSTLTTDPANSTISVGG